MKIIGITPNNQMTGETPEQMYLRKLRDLGHEVIIGEKFNTIPRDTDIIVAMSEVSCENAFNLANCYNIPYYAHMEWIPHWRVFYDTEQNWGYENSIFSYKEKMSYVRLYQHYSFFWSMANVKSLAANCFHQSVTDFIGRQLLINTKYLGVDVDRINSYKELSKTPVKKNNEITCVARFVPHKRIHHVLEALIKMGFNGTLNLVGYGGELERYQNYCIPFYIKYWDSKDKFEAMARSKLTIALWSGMVPAESCYLGTPALTYESPYMVELYGDKMDYALNNDIDSLATMISLALKRTAKEDKKLCESTINAINNGEINTLTQENAVKLLESFLKQTIEIYKK